MFTFLYNSLDLICKKALASVRGLVSDTKVIWIGCMMLMGDIVKGFAEVEYYDVQLLFVKVEA